MLLRYAQNLAAGHGIRWSLNQAPVDGATDFLYMVAIAGLSRITHLDVVAASRWVNIGAQMLTIPLLFFSARRLFGANRWIVAAMVMLVVGGPAVVYTNACFGAPFFAFFLLACWCAALLFLQHASWPVAMLTALLGLLAGLTRPEGVLIAATLVCATAYLRPMTRRELLKLVVSFLAIFGVLGGIYFAWRWQYFGYPLPNPFYVKGGGHLYFDSVKHAAMNIVVMLLPVLWILPLGWLAPSTRRLTTALCGILITFTTMWILLSNANNHFARFQYAVYPLTLLTLTAIASGFAANFGLLKGRLLEKRPLERERKTSSMRPAAHHLPTFAVCTLALCSALLYLNHTYFYVPSAWGMRNFALRLAPLASRGYTMAVTEAGALPLYSRWNAVDGLGLNDAFIAHHHMQSTVEYLDRYHPEIIMVHLDRSIPTQFLRVIHGAPPVPDTGMYLQEMLSYYARTHGYTLAAAWGADQCNLHFYWVRPGFPDYATVVADIRTQPYIFLDDFFVSHDYRNDLDSLQVCIENTDAAM